MKATELRIGNWVKLSSLTDGTESDIEVGAFHFNEIGRTVKYQYKPIPLSKEWLERFGFNFDVNSGLYKKSGFEVEVFNIGVEFYLGEYGSWFLFVEHVHQLQNLYFALTGEELELKEVEQ